jgi:hypothetical protein
MRAAPPTSRRGPDWRDASACRREDPDLFAPDGSTGKWVEVIAQAKAICNRCPVREICLNWALDTRQESGIWGGLTEDERWNLRRREVRNARRPTQNPRGPKLPPPNSLKELFARHANPSTGGHLVWIGMKTPIYAGRQFTPGQVAFIADRGREPKGMVQRTCGVGGCVQPAHLADERERYRRRAKAAV